MLWSIPPEGVHLQESLAQLWVALRVADAFWFITQVCNCSIPGALKSAIDRQSRAPNRDTIYGKVGAASGGGYGTCESNCICDTS
jgi:NAD(P)H-dependent FMN reductase